MKAPPCEHCGRRDTSFTGLWLRAQRQLRRQRGMLAELRHNAAVANAKAEEERAKRLDSDQRCRRATEALDFLVSARFDQIAKGNEGPA